MRQKRKQRRIRLERQLEELNKLAKDMSEAMGSEVGKYEYRLHWFNPYSIVVFVAVLAAVGFISSPVAIALEEFCGYIVPVVALQLFRKICIIVVVSVLGFDLLECCTNPWFRHNLNCTKLREELVACEIRIYQSEIMEFKDEKRLYRKVKRKFKLLKNVVKDEFDWELKIKQKLGSHKVELWLDDDICKTYGLNGWGYTDLVQLLEEERGRRALNKDTVNKFEKRLKK